jgi:very-short-patch-repair endonuclease
VDPSPQLLALARAQSGVVTAGQAETLGLGRHSRQRLLRSGQWQRLDGPVLLAGAEPANWLGLAWAGVLLGGDGARLAGEAAAFLHGLTQEEPDVLRVLARCPVRSRDPWLFRREEPGHRSARSPGEPPRTTIEDTVMDLCEGVGVGEAVDWITRAVQTRRTSVRRLQACLDQRSRHSRRRLLDELLADLGLGAESPLELRYLRDVERAHGLPAGHRQHRSGDRYRRDVVYLLYRLVVELDGRLGHEGAGRFRDMRRDNWATVEGEATLRYGFTDVAGYPCLVARQVWGVLSTRGFPGELQRCPRCPTVWAEME